MSDVTLRDGSVVHIRPLRRDDRDAIASTFSQLSDESRYRRFLGATPRLTSSMLDHLTAVDGVDHLALVALDPATGAGVGVARALRSADDPDEAEAAVTVVDAWQGRGLGTTLVAALVDVARPAGLRRFTALTLAANAAAIRVFEGVGEHRLSTDGSTVAITVDLPEPGDPPGEDMLALLRSSAAGTLATWGGFLQRISVPPRLSRPPIARGPLRVVVALPDDRAAAEAFTTAVDGTLVMASGRGDAVAALLVAADRTPADVILVRRDAVDASFLAAHATCSVLLLGDARE